MIAPRFNGADVERAHAEWGANCGPTAAAAILGLTLDEVRPFFDAVDFPSRRYTNPTMMLDVLRATKLEWEVRAASVGVPTPAWPTWGLVRIQWEGPWMQPGVPIRARYRQTHWVGASHRAGAESVGIFDVNIVGSGPKSDHAGWTDLKSWSEIIVPMLTADIPRASGTWSVTHSIEVRR